LKSQRGRRKEKGQKGIQNDRMKLSKKGGGGFKGTRSSTMWGVFFPHVVQSEGETRGGKIGSKRGKEDLGDPITN